MIKLITMTTRVVGRGKYPKCGNQGSIVFKEINNKIYVYAKHGRKWCYLGPLEAVDLSTRNYHYFTAKINDYLKKKQSVINMKTSLLVFIN